MLIRKFMTQILRLVGFSVYSVHNPCSFHIPIECLHAEDVAQLRYIPLKI